MGMPEAFSPIPLLSTALRSLSTMPLAARSLNGTEHAPRTPYSAIANLSLPIALVLAFCGYLALGITIGSGSASASDIRTAVAVDPKDAPSTVSGKPAHPDLRRLDITYNRSGSLRIKVSFYNSIDELDESSGYASWSTFTLGEGDPDTCSILVLGQHHVYSRRGILFHDQADVIGIQGTVKLTRHMSEDGKTVVLTAESHALANLNVECFSYELRERRETSWESSNSRYDEHCDCWYFSRELDSVEDKYFTGYSRPLPNIDEYDAEDTFRTQLSERYGPAWATRRHVSLACWRIDPQSFSCSAYWTADNLKYHVSMVITARTAEVIHDDSRPAIDQGAVNNSGSKSRTRLRTRVRARRCNSLIGVV